MQYLRRKITLVDGRVAADEPVARRDPAAAAAAGANP
jgi:hypothetical protein